MNDKIINIFCGDRFEFESHINEFLVYRENAVNTEAFLVEIPCGMYTHNQIHEDMEQIFYIISGSGIIKMQKTLNSTEEIYYISEGDVVHIPINYYHKIINEDQYKSLKYLCVNAFSNQKKELLSLEHAENVKETYNMNNKLYSYIESPVLVLGASGFLGSNMIKKLLEKGKKVLGVDTVLFNDNNIDDRLKKNFSFELITNKREFKMILSDYFLKYNILPDNMVCFIGNNSYHNHIYDLETSDFEKQIKDNLVSVYDVIRDYSKLLIDNHLRGNIIISGSIGARHSHREMIGYDSAKGAIESMCRSLALDLAPYRINVNTIEFGPIEQSVSSLDDAEFTEGLRSLMPIKRYPTIEEVVSYVYEFVNRDNCIITGQVLVVDGGLLSQLRPLKLERLWKRSRYE